MPAVFTRMEVGFALEALAFVRDIHRRRDNRTAQCATKNFLKARHLHQTRRFSGFGPTWAAFWFFAQLFAFPLAAFAFAVAILVTALAIFSFHKDD